MYPSSTTYGVGPEQFSTRHLTSLRRSLDAAVVGTLTLAQYQISRRANASQYHTRTVGPEHDNTRHMA
eukprot:3852712-Rhodomonas_salina.3